MTQEFDKLISNSAPVVPDRGASRRMARTLLHEEMRHQEQRRRRRNRRGILVAVSLVFILALGGQVTELGSDGFGLLQGDLPNLDQNSTIYETEFRNTAFNAPKSWSEDKVQEFLQTIEADEGRVLRIVGIEIESKILWTKRVERQIEDELQVSATSVESPPSELSSHHLPFMKTHLKNIYKLIKTTPPVRTATVNIEGVDHEFGVWEFDLEEIGEVTFYYVSFQ